MQKFPQTGARNYLKVCNNLPHGGKGLHISNSKTGPETLALRGIDDLLKYLWVEARGDPPASTAAGGATDLSVPWDRCGHRRSWPVAPDGGGRGCAAQN